MNVEIRDASAVQMLRPLEVAAYLRSTGWNQKAASTKVSVWGRKSGDDEFEATVPLVATVRDYALRMGDVLRVIAAAENRSQAQVYTDLLTTFADVVRIRIDDPEAKDGTLSIEAHAQIAQRARDLLLAAACSATEHRAVWPATKPARAVEQVRKLRVGQSERGSYIVTVISRVSPALETPADGRLFEAEVPFERQVVQTLATSLATLDTAAATAALSGKFDSFAESVAHGVSANLCDAVAGLWGDDGQQRTLEFSFTWSPARPLEVSAPERVRFTADSIPVIREASRVMKERAPMSDFRIEGPVVKLDRQPDAASGKVTVFGAVENRPTRVTLELSEPQYSRAVAAHRDQLVFSCVGTLVREGRNYRLQNPRDVSVEEE
ncbi:MAG: hypothetical protein J0I06_12575 [Planctomycetes bacterium]|nr:hypothetical protein [Planctomycetota bacterium]